MTETPERSVLVNLIDGDNLYHRAYFRFSEYHNGAIYGFINSLNRIVKNYPPDHMLICWGDRRQNLWRRDMHPGYKSHRNSELGVNFSEQWPILRKLLKAMGLANVSIPKFEADDLLADISKVRTIKSSDEENPAAWLIFGNDKDLLQLIRDPEAGGGFVKVIRDKKFKQKNVFVEFTEEDVIELMGVRAKDIPLLLAITGDKSDDVPGVPGLGPTYGARIIKHIDGDIVKIMGAMIKVPKVSRKLMERVQINRDQIILSLKLTDLLNPPVHSHFNIYDIPPPTFNKEGIYEIMQEMDLIKHIDIVKSIIEKVHGIEC